MDETHADTSSSSELPEDPDESRKVGRAVFLGAVLGGVSSLYWGKAGWSKVSAALSP